MYAKVLKFHIWIPHEKKSDELYIFLIQILKNISGVMALCTLRHFYFVLSLEASIWLGA